MKKDFEYFLQEQHIKQYQGSKSNCVDNYEYWIENLDIDDLIYFANLYGIEKAQETLENVKKDILDNINERTKNVETEYKDI